MITILLEKSRYSDPNFPGLRREEKERITVRARQIRTHTGEHSIVYYNNASDYKNIQSINEYYTEISEI